MAGARDFADMARQSRADSWRVCALRWDHGRAAMFIKLDCRSEREINEKHCAVKSNQASITARMRCAKLNKIIIFLSLMQRIGLKYFMKYVG